MNEEWKDVIGYESLYKVSNKGTLIRKQFSVVDIDGRNRTYSEKKIKPSINSSGYKKVVLRKNGVGSNEYLHRLIAMHFIPNPLELPQVNHKDGNKLNCNISNLEWVSISENSQHAFDNDLRYITGYNRTVVGEKNRRFSDDDVLEIMNYYNDGWTQKEISDYMGCYDSTINNIVNGKKYKTPECEAIDDWKYIINRLNTLRKEYLQTREYSIWKHIVEILPSSWLQTRTITVNYENLYSMIRQRKNHKLTEWSVSFINWCKTLPYSDELLFLDLDKKGEN
nr:NUMOD4 motif-containing HNH endonuclease [Clostridium sp. HBUAS56010]